MKRLITIISLTGILLGCGLSKPPPGLKHSSIEQQNKAVANVGCVFENQNACSHIVENRLLLASFYSPKGLGNKTEEEKLKGRRITTKFVVEHAGNIQQCRKETAAAILVLNKLEIAGSKYKVLATAPISEQSSCYLAVDTENL